jgi:hypothetical protein
MHARLLFATTSLALTFAGCSSILSIEPGQLDDAASSGSGSMASGGGADAGAVSECDLAADCTAAPFPDCRAITCVDHRCHSVDAPAGTPTVSQVSGDCQQIECDGHGLVHSVEAADPRDDGRECTDDTCAQGVPSNPARAAGTACTQGGGAVCSGAGDCIGCLVDADCGGKICKGTICVPTGCSDGLKNGAETDVDCGGPCSPCANALHCVLAVDCQSGVCKGKICKPPTCLDFVKNGGESDVDCGGACLPCGDGKGCGDPSDCFSGVCASDVCCTPKSDAMTCLGHCGPVLDNCGQSVTCGVCPAMATCVQGLCICFPDPPMTTCANKCGLIANNCNQVVDCGPCPP